MTPSYEVEEYNVMGGQGDRVEDMGEVKERRRRGRGGT